VCSDSEISSTGSWSVSVSSGSKLSPIEAQFLFFLARNSKSISPKKKKLLSVVSGFLELDDAGLLKVDSGLLEVDSGLLEVNSGLLEVDSGLLEVDSGLLEVNSGLL